MKMRKWNPGILAATSVVLASVIATAAECAAQTEVTGHVVHCSDAKSGIEMVKIFVSDPRKSGTPIRSRVSRCASSSEIPDAYSGKNGLFRVEAPSRDGVVLYFCKSGYKPSPAVYRLEQGKEEVTVCLRKDDGEDIEELYEEFTRVKEHSESVEEKGRLFLAWVWGMTAQGISPATKKALADRLAEEEPDILKGEIRDLWWYSQTDREAIDGAREQLAQSVPNRGLMAAMNEFGEWRLPNVIRFDLLADVIADTLEGGKQFEDFLKGENPDMTPQDRIAAAEVRLRLGWGDELGVASSGHRATWRDDLLYVFATATVKGGRKARLYPAMISDGRPVFKVIGVGTPTVETPVARNVELGCMIPISKGDLPEIVLESSNLIPVKTEFEPR